MACFGLCLMRLQNHRRQTMNQPKRPPPAKPWAKGQSGNPKGRPKGVPSKIVELRKAIAADVPGILKRMAEMALLGDVQAARLLLERAIPPLKAAEQSIILSLPDGTLTDQGRAILTAVSSGHIPPTQGSQLITALGTLARVAEIDDLTARITILEQKHGTT